MDERAPSVVVSTDDPFLVSFRQLLQDEVEQVKRQLAGGFATTYDDYRYRVGMIAGFMRCYDLANDLAKQMRG